ncbi:Lrp/AsnC family transcriptional regulator [Herbiconiux sp. CPCC 205716]|uniref:Lrp/AsnC family transcriptional regulator n=1 Tax=Herbiconiux gentiana TaxID=2970912 RepID=A0ABT2GHE5_9MICO|nr:Lrp/AsnC family transcriptional regulator [Herbiconiux gentiana]MCS5715649.1 Lrp/AsnC family transcriptional regulator [Herbiconiux gentiana]
MAHTGGTAAIDDIDERIVWELCREARLPNKELAERVGIAPSTCLVRVRALHASGVLRSFHAQPDWASLGLPIEAIVQVRLKAQARAEIRSYAQRVITLPNVLNVFFLGGADDFLIHVACTSTGQLRDFVATELSMDNSVASTQTNIVFDHLIGVQHMQQGSSWSEVREAL